MFIEVLWNVVGATLVWLWGVGLGGFLLWMAVHDIKGGAK